MTSRSYTSPKCWIMKFTGCRTWSQVWERYQEGEIEAFSALAAEGLLTPNRLRDLMIQERVHAAAVQNKTAIIREIAIELRLSEGAVRSAAYGV